MPTLESLRATAAEQAAALGSNFVGSEHLFLASLLTGSGPAHEAATGAGLTADTFLAVLAGRGPQPGRAAPGGEAGGLSSHAERVVATAGELARSEQRDQASADDVLLALIREPRGAVARALAEAKVKPSQLRAMLRPKPRHQGPAAQRGGGAMEVPGAAPESIEPRPRSRPETPPPRPRDRTPARPRPGRDPEIDDIPEPRAPERPRLTPPPRPAPPVRRERRWSWVWLLCLAIPVSVWLRLTNGDPSWLFVAAAVSIVPLAGLIASTTEQVALRSGPMTGALLNATFGNATELIVAIVALDAGYIDLVKASLTGSILSNLLLILGLALFTGGLRQPTLTFSRTAAGMSAAMLALAVAGLILPSVVVGSPGDHHVALLSEVVAAILAVTYVGSLLFTMHTHKRLFAGGAHDALTGKPWPLGAAIGALAAATVVVAVESEFLVRTIGVVTESLHLSQFFLGLVVIPIVGNAAEHATAIGAAQKGFTELAVQIAVGSSTQVALLVAPLLVLVGALLGQPLTLVFPAFQVAALAIATLVTAIATLDGESHWLEGMQLVALYVMIATAAWFI